MNSPPSPGALLREKRIETGQTVSEVAHILRLSTRQMEALENDDYPNLPGRTYVLGYWKSCAQLLDISIEESIEAHKKNLRDEESGVMLDRGHPRHRDRVENSRRRFGLVFTLLSAVFLLTIWHWQNPDANSLPEQRNPGVVGEPTDIALQIAALEAWTGGLEGPDEQAHPLSSAPQTPLPEPNFSAENDPFRTEQASLGANAAGNAGPGQTGPGAAGEAQPDTPRNQLILDVARPSWIEVRDDTGAQLLYRKVAGGQRLILRGKPPFSVFIGNTEGVVVEYRGKPVQLPAGEDGLFARFNVGGG